MRGEIFILKKTGRFKSYLGFDGRQRVAAWLNTYSSTVPGVTSPQVAREGRQNVTLAIYAVDVFDKITFVESVIFCRDRNQFFLATKLRIVQIELQFFKG